VTEAFNAVPDYGYDEGKGNEEGLEISRLGISQEIIGALAKKGITKLFPIQVILSFPF
jgi:ATP-dependent RNA helicase DDX21